MFEACEKARKEASQKGLYRSTAEHDACGVGFVADLKGRPLKTPC